jgi:hypothetical protein
MEINHIKLGVTLFLALTLSTLFVDGVETYIAGQVLSEASKELKKHDKRKKTAEIRQAHKDRIANIAKNEENKKNIDRKRNNAERLRSLKRTNNKTCKYWKNQYSEGKSEYRKQMKIAACKRARND